MVGTATQIATADTVTKHPRRLPGKLIQIESQLRLDCTAIAYAAPPLAKIVHCAIVGNFFSA